MVNRNSAWATPAAVLLALQLCTGASGGPLEDGRAVYVAADYPQVSDPAARWDRLATTPGAGVANEIEVHTARTADGKAVKVEVALGLPVDHDVVWAVLTDYENMPRFVPDIRATRVSSAGRGRTRVAIEGLARFLFMDFPINTTVDAIYHPAGTIAIDSVAGNLAINGVVRVLAEGGYTRVDYRVRIAPDFWLPPLIGDFLIGRLIKRQFAGMVAEMHRRADGHQTRRLDGPKLAPFSPASYRRESLSARDRLPEGDFTLVV